MQFFKIKKGCRRGGIIDAPFRFRPTKLRAKISFGSACWYNTEVAGDHVNKVIGINFGLLPHKNSIRLGWRPSNKANRLELMPYTYVNGTRYILEEHKIIYPVQSIIAFHLDWDNSVKSWKFRLFDRNEVLLNCQIPIQKVLTIAYLQSPYFGGEPKAPHDMDLHIFGISTE
jgi:hypothetical protein